MTNGTAPAASDLSNISETLEVAHSILQRHRDPDLADKTFVVQEYLEMSKMHPEWDYRELLNKAHADLTSAVHLHLNVELAAIGVLLSRFSSTREVKYKEQAERRRNINSVAGGV